MDIADEKLLSSREMSSKRRVITGIEKQWQHTRIPFEIVKIGLTSLDQGFNSSLFLDFQRSNCSIRSSLTVP